MSRSCLRGSWRNRRKLPTPPSPDQRFQCPRCPTAVPPRTRPAPATASRQPRRPETVLGVSTDTLFISLTSFNEARGEFRVRREVQMDVAHEAVSDAIPLSALTTVFLAETIDSRDGLRNRIECRIVKFMTARVRAVRAQARLV